MIFPLNHVTQLKHQHFHQMEALTVIPSNPEGFGSLLQFALSAYIVAREKGIPYVHSEFQFEHATQEGKNEKEWNAELNNAVKSFVPCHVFKDREPHNVGVMRPEKLFLEIALRNRSPIFRELSNRYLELNKTPCYFDKSRVNIAIHARTFNSTDCDTSSFREYVKPGSESDTFLLEMIRQLSAAFPGCYFHLYAKDKNMVAHYATISNMHIYSETSLLSDLHHMIVADILIMAKSSLSLIASYYRSGPSLIRESYGYAVPPTVSFVHNNELKQSDILGLILCYGDPLLVKKEVIMASCSDEKVPDKL